MTYKYDATYFMMTGYILTDTAEVSLFKNATRDCV